MYLTKQHYQVIADVCIQDYLWSRYSKIGGERKFWKELHLGNVSLIPIWKNPAGTRKDSNIGNP